MQSWPLRAHVTTATNAPLSKACCALIAAEASHQFAQMPSSRSTRSASHLPQLSDDMWGIVILHLHAADLASMHAAFPLAKNPITEMLGKTLSLNAQQARAVFQIVVLRRNTFLTGGAGVGKTHVITKAAEMLQSIFTEKRRRLAAAKEALEEAESQQDVAAATAEVERVRRDHDLATDVSKTNEYKWHNERCFYTGRTYSDDDDDEDDAGYHGDQATMRGRRRHRRPIRIEDLACVTFMGSAARVADSDALRASTIHLLFGVTGVRREATDPPARLVQKRDRDRRAHYSTTLPTAVINRATRLKLKALKVLVVDEARSSRHGLSVSGTLTTASLGAGVHGFRRDV